MKLTITFLLVSVGVCYCDFSGSGGPAISTQSSEAHGHDDSTAISSGDSMAKGGPDGAISTQGSKATGGRGSTVVADGHSKAVSKGHFHHHGGSKFGGGFGSDEKVVGGIEGPSSELGGVVKSGPWGSKIKGGIRQPGGSLGGKIVDGGGLGFGGGFGGGRGPAVSTQKTEAHGKDGSTVIGSGDSSALSKSGGPAISSQETISSGGSGSTVVAQGSSSAVSFRKRRAVEDKVNGTTISEPTPVNPNTGKVVVSVKSRRSLNIASNKFIRAINEVKAGNTSTIDDDIKPSTSSSRTGLLIGDFVKYAIKVSNSTNSKESKKPIIANGHVSTII